MKHYKGVKIIFLNKKAKTPGQKETGSEIMRPECRGICKCTTKRSQMPFRTTCLPHAQMGLHA